ncbi:hypothetical protein [Nevskia ramosa]|uniref:hypothetical protein n=1 Tax=Nevskia ramosa TaxID=64002 RepID=UPI003D13C061
MIDADRLLSSASVLRRIRTSIERGAAKLPRVEYEQIRTDMLVLRDIEDDLSERSAQAEFARLHPTTKPVANRIPRSTGTLYEHRGSMRTLPQIAQMEGVSTRVLRRKLKAFGMSLEAALAVTEKRA